MDDKKGTHLAHLRVLVRRMRAGSFMLKAWSVAIVGALLALSSIPAHVRFGWLALAMAIGFWMFDAHLARQARLFEKTYQRVAEQKEEEIDFSTDTKAVDGEQERLSAMMFRFGLVGFHGVVAVAATITQLWFEQR